MKNKQGGLTTGKDEMHIIVIDELGDITGAPGTILEKHSNLSKMLGAVTDSGDNNYCLLYTSPSPRDLSTSRMPSSA